jgi:hypothetical protein
MNIVAVKLLSAIGIAGEIIPAGEIIEIPEDNAKNLLHRGKAELATEADEPAEDDALATKSKKG